MAKGAKEQFEDILHQKEYQIYYEDNRNLLQRLKDWIVDLLAKLLEKVFPALESTTNIAGILVTIIVIIVVFILAIMLTRISKNISRKRKFQSSVPLTNLHELEWTYEDHFETAYKKEKSLQYGHAVRHLFLALLLYYHEINWLKAEIWKTNWDYFEELRKTNRSSANVFYELMKLFDDVTYGKRMVTADEYHAYKQKVKDLFDEAQKLKQVEKEE